MKKHRLELFQANDNDAIEKHLKNMAKKGWFLEKAGRILWSYTSGEPQDITYEVTYFSEASDFNPNPTDNQQTYYEYCEATGWTLVDQRDEMQIFRAVREDTTPIESDQALKLQSIHKFMMKKIVLPSVFTVLVIIFGIFVMLNSMKHNPILFFFGGTELYNSLYWMVIGVLMMYFIIDYGVWYYGSKEALVIGIKYEKNHYKGRRIAVIICISLISIIAMLQITSIIGDGYWWMILMMLALTIPSILVSLAAKKRMKKSGFSREENKTLTVITALTVWGIMWVVIYPFVDDRINGEVPYDSYKNQPSASLTIEDLSHDSLQNNSNTNEGRSHYSLYTEDSFAASYTSIYQQSQLDYTVATIKIAMFYDTFKNYYLDTYEFYGGGTFILVDEPVWEALEVYRLKTEISLRNTYVVCYEDKILYISLYFPLKADQVRLIRERLIE
ncbi:DUF2812 domain-containing protein [Alloiococcus sp. CFN-8]|uniref:DUF2812 domain-containing protein n=1 Tax=Alloiococcus sp. CFN-8 TaxID=3416081 RepID=UPI003CEA2E02